MELEPSLCPAHHAIKLAVYISNFCAKLLLLGAAGFSCNVCARPVVIASKTQITFTLNSALGVLMLLIMVSSSALSSYPQFATSEPKDSDRPGCREL
jgi:hypothetical protein